MKSYIENILDTLVNQIGDRPTGSENDKRANHFVQNCFKELGYEVKSLGFDCVCWEI